MRNETREIKVRGMICRACTDAVEAALLSTRGVISARASYFKGSCTVEYDPDIVCEDALCRAIEASGYETGDKGMSGILVDIICLAATVLLVWLLMTINLNPIPEAREGASLGYIFLIGLLTSTHCVCMCGGIMLCQTAGARVQSPRLSALAYNGGRAAAYTLMGGLFGALGTVISYSAQTRSMIFTMAGLLVAVIGMNMWGLLPGLRALAPGQSSYCAVSAKRKSIAGRPLAVGLLTGLMPCGPLYAMWLFAVSCGSAISGAAAMLAFSLGTVPLMLLFGALNSFVPRKWMKYMLKLSAVLVTAMGIKMLLNGLVLGGFL